jgi:glycosyltransferase involved in cell wall biosynthesis
MSLKPKILFVHNALSTFVRIDRDLLAQEYAIDELYLKNKSQLNPLAIWKRVKANDLVFAWFASWHSFLPLLFAHWQGKPSVLVAGGYDTANVPEAAYGNQRSWFPCLITNLTIRLAAQIICNSDYTKNETAKAAGVPLKRITRVYHGIPSNGITHSTSKKNLVLNVGIVSKENLLRKGLEPFIKAGALQQKFQFVQVGKWKDKIGEQLKSTKPSHVFLKGFVSEDELHELYASAKYYVQASLHEGFGMSVVEAMQAGAIPIVSDYGALPEVVRDKGYILPEPTAKAIAEAITILEESQSIKPSDCAKFTRETYSLEMRKSGLYEVLSKSV